MAKSFLSFMDACRQASSSTGAHWCPAADIYQTTDGWLIKLDLAGINPSELHFNPSELHLECRGNRVVVSGERRDAVATQSVSSYALEISYNRFERSLELPCEIETAQVATEYRDGMLIVRLICASEKQDQ
jgi:HSP20 family protein